MLAPSPAFVQKATATLNNTSNTVQLTGVGAGNFLAVIESCFTGASGSSNVSFNKPTDSSGDAWWQGVAPIGLQPGGGGSCVAGCAFAPNVAGGTHTVTIAATGFSMTGHVTLVEFSGFPALVALDQGTYNGGTTAQTLATGNTPATQSAIALVLAGIAIGTGTGVSNAAITDPPSGFTSLYVQNTTTTDIGVEHCYAIKLPGQQSASWSWSDATTIASQCVVAAFGPYQLTGAGVQ